MNWAAEHLIKRAAADWLREAGRGALTGLNELYGKPYREAIKTEGGKLVGPVSEGLGRITGATHKATRGLGPAYEEIIEDVLQGRGSALGAHQVLERAQRGMAEQIQPVVEKEITNVAKRLPRAGSNIIMAPARHLEKTVTPQRVSGGVAKLLTRLLGKL